MSIAQPGTIILSEATIWYLDDEKRLRQYITGSHTISYTPNGKGNLEDWYDFVVEMMSRQNETYSRTISIGDETTIFNVHKDEMEIYVIKYATEHPIKCMNISLTANNVVRIKITPTVKKAMLTVFGDVLNMSQND